MTAASSFLHSLPAAVHPHETARHLTTALAGAVVRTLRRSPCRAHGDALVTCLSDVLADCRRLVVPVVPCRASPLRLNGIS